MFGSFSGLWVPVVVKSRTERGDGEATAKEKKGAKKEAAALELQGFAQTWLKAPS